MSANKKIIKDLTKQITKMYDNGHITIIELEEKLSKILGDHKT